MVVTVDDSLQLFSLSHWQPFTTLSLPLCQRIATIVEKNGIRAKSSIYNHKKKQAKKSN